MNNIFFTKGQSLWEVIIALALAGLVATGLVKILSSTVKGTRFSADQTLATTLAQKKINEIIDMKNTNWDGFWSMVTSGSPITDPTVEGFCFLTLVSDQSAVEIPTTTPNYLSAKLFKISVDVFFDEKEETGSNICNNKSYEHKFHFETFTAN